MIPVRTIIYLWLWGCGQAHAWLQQLTEKSIIFIFYFFPQKPFFQWPKAGKSRILCYSHFDFRLPFFIFHLLLLKIEITALAILYFLTARKLFVKTKMTLKASQHFPLAYYENVLPLFHTFLLISVVKVRFRVMSFLFNFFF